ncbi:MAG: hypothetical protein IT310_11985 [Anaerolineales bacterium]|nr:hypothetical protein [Anaerolineales bacterium]
MNLIRTFFRTLSVERLWGIAILFCIFIYVNTQPILPYDFWLHIASGREIVTTASIPTVDTFSYTRAGTPFTSASAYWLMQIVMYWIYEFGGGALVVVCQSLAITAAYAILFFISVQTSQNFRASAVGLAFAVLFGYGNWNVRPQTLAYLLSALLLLALYQYRKGHGWRWLILPPILLMIWVNSHPSFPLGLLILGCWAFETLAEAFKSGEWKKIQAPFLVGLAASAACLLSPYGLKIGAYVFNLISASDISSYIIEWRPPSFETTYGAAFLIGLCVSAVFFIASIKKISWMEILLFLIFGWLGLKYIRGAVWFGIVTAPLLSQIFARFIPLQNVPESKSANFINRALFFFLLTIALLSLPYFKALLPFSEEKSGVLSAETPISAVEFIKTQRLRGNIFHAADFSSYLMWAGQPEYPVFIDLRFDTTLYPLSLWDEYAAISAARPGWEEKLASYQVNTLLLSPKDQPELIQAAGQSQAWKIVYQDEISIVFTKQPE